MSQLKRRRRRRLRLKPRFFIIIALLLLALALGIVALMGGFGKEDDPDKSRGLFGWGKTPAPEASGSPTPEPTPTPLPAFSPAAVDGTRPSDFGLETGLEVDGTLTDAYTRTGADKIDFGLGEEYTGLKGIITFRGNNFREGASYGTAALTQKKFAAEPWKFKVGSLKKVYQSGAGGDSWTGCGWTGQPLMIQWPEETKAIMNLYADAKAKKDLVEVIYATMDGNIYFLDAQTGEKTRDPISVGFPFKGAGALDPRGIPLMYVGSGDDSPQDGGKLSRAFIISLVDGKVLYEFGNNDSFSLRPKLYYFDGSPLVDALTDTLIWASETGIVYTIKLNTKYDEAAGTLSIDPKPTVKWRYKGSRSGVNNQYWLGVEDSIIMWREHAIFSDNGGHLICLDMNTYETKWVQDTLDDTNCTPVLELEGADKHPYVYTSTSFHAGWRAGENSMASIPIWKIDAVSGEIVSKTEYQCATASGVSGGVQGTMVLGKNKLSDLIIVPVAYTPSGFQGKLVALDKNDLTKERWVFEMTRYPWSSPVAVYDAAGNGYIVQCNQEGNMYLLDGATGELLDTINLESNIEASPAVFGNTVVVGTRGGYIYGITLE